MSYCSINNDNKNCPIKMSDGRAFTNYEPRCVRNASINEQLQKNNMLKSSYEQRLYLQNNYEKIIEEERKRAMATITPCYPCKAGELINEKNKELDNKYIVQCDGVSCYKTMVNEKGLGTGNFF